MPRVCLQDHRKRGPAGPPASLLGPARSPHTVRQRLEAYQAELGFGTFCGVFQFGSLGHEDFAESLGLFADKVLPSVRSLP